MMALHRRQQTRAEKAKREQRPQRSRSPGTGEAVDPEQRNEKVDDSHHRKLERESADRFRVERDALRERPLRDCADICAKAVGDHIRQRREPRDLEQLDRFDRTAHEQRNTDDAHRSNIDVMARDGVQKSERNEQRDVRENIHRAAEQHDARPFGHGELEWQQRNDGRDEHDVREKRRRESRAGIRRRSRFSNWNLDPIDRDEMPKNWISQANENE